MINYLYAFILLVGLILLYFAWKKFKQSTHLLDHGIRTTATVIQNKRHSDSDGVIYTPVFEFTDRNGQSVYFEGEISSNPPTYKVGQVQKIVYDPENENKAKTITFWGLYRWVILLFALACPPLIIGGGYFIFTYG